MPDAKDSDKEKKQGGAGESANTKPAAVGQANPAGAPAAGSTDYQFFVDGSSGGYSFGLGQPAFDSGPKLDTSLPDWFQNAGSAANTNSNSNAIAAANINSSASAAASNAASAAAGVAANAAANANNIASYAAPTYTAPSYTTPTYTTPAYTPPPAPPPVPPTPAYSTPPYKASEYPAVVYPAAISPPQTQSPSALAKEQALPNIVPAQTPLPAVRRMEGAFGPVPLDLRFDERFNKLSLTKELSQTVDRIFSLNDLDFNGFVDFDEITKMLEGDELTASEKQFVQLIYQVGKKIVAERPVDEYSTAPVMSKEDFRLAFASVLHRTLPGLNVGPAAGASPAAPTRAFRPTVYAEEDYPLGSIKAQAVKLGTMGDAYFAACLVSLIDMQPRSIMRMINNSTDQGFLINFPGLHGKGLELMPPRAEEIMHYGLAEKYGYWYPLMEKAFGMYVAQNHKLAASMDHGKDPFPRTAQAMEALANASMGKLVVADFEPESLRVGLLDILSKGKIMVAISADNISQGATIAGAAPLPQKPYAVQGYDQNTSRMIVRGVGTVNTSNLDESVLRLTTDQFAHYFKLIYFEKELDSASPAKTDSQPAKTIHNPWRTLPGE